MRMPLFSALAVTAVLSACGTFDSDAVEAFTSVRPLEADLGQYEVIVNLPDGIDIKPGGAALVVSATHSDTRASTSQTYVMQRRDTGEGRIVYRLSPGDVGQLEGQQALIREWAAETGGKTDGQFGINVDACQTGSGPNLNDRMSVDLVTLSSGQRRVLIPPTPVRNFVITGGDNELLLGSC